MSKDKKDLVDSSANDKLGPDYFGYYTRLVTDLLSKEEDFPPFASQSYGLSQSRGVELRGKDTIEHSYGIPGSLFGNSIGTGLSDFRKERLKSLLRQGVKVLSPEVDEVCWDAYSSFFFLNGRFKQVNYVSAFMILNYMK